MNTAPKSTAAAGEGRRHHDLIEAIVAETVNRLPGALAEQGNVLAHILLNRIPPEELDSRENEEWAALMCSLLEFASDRKPGQPKLRIFNPTQEEHGWNSSHTVIEIVNDDMPFLVDSVGMVLSGMELGMHFLLHPLICVKRDSDGRLENLSEECGQSAPGQVESLIYLEVDRQTEPAILKKMKAGIERALADIRAAVTDWQAMRERMCEVASVLRKPENPVEDALETEAAAFLRWLVDEHFTFLGFREYELAEEEGEEVLRAVPGTGLGILKQASGTSSRRSLTELAKQAQELKLDPEPLIVTKTNARATVHRQGYLDYIGVLRYADDGTVIGEKRFIGLYTSSAYNQRPWEIPLVRRKVEAIMRRSELPRQSHAGKALWHILETLPRDELFQASEDELYELAMGILSLQERQRTKLFVRRDRWGRFFSCLVFIPRERYNTELRHEIQRILKRAFKGERVDYNVELAETSLARVYLVVRPKRGEPIEYDLPKLETRLERAVRSWNDELRDILIEKVGEEAGIRLANRFASAFPAAYTEDVSPTVASYDVEQLDALESPNDIRMSLYKPRRQRGGSLRFKVFKQGRTIPLSDALPMLENLGLRLVSERPYELKLPDNTRVWVQDFDMEPLIKGELDLSKVRKHFQRAFEGVFRKHIENDGFNRLVLSAHLDWRKVAMLRSYCKFLLQARIPFSQSYMEQTLARHPDIARAIAALFEARFSPKRDQDRIKLQARIVREMEANLDHVQSQDEDRILRAFNSVVLATVRTNYFQLHKGEAAPYLAFKISSSRLPDLPKPRPMMEFFVCSPRLEATHLRTGIIARGGLRWSDRREDFRTEVLGLMKAQNVKNTMIVPVGAKGGFVVKQLTPDMTRDEFMGEVVACYQFFINAMLDLTDNYAGEEIKYPERVVRHDGDDPYLVVAADKGTATFSDIANAIAEKHRFWLGDAFASGGSHGYDHKKMGITARGGWESVKRHFREMGKDIQKEPFTVAGIGDMAGDVFGNGMLLSRQIRLQAAFNHQHIFLDPDPDPATSYEERRRLFNLDRSTWSDYESSKISRGGGIFARSAKTIAVSKEVRDWLALDTTDIAPQELIRAILKAPVDLLWNGGIGTYVKSESESSADVGDRSNDSLRVNGNELRCKVVGEGGNLGVTQLGRIEYALNGGRLNADFVDNSAGVDCSDHEVNIKILFNNAMASGKLDLEERNRILSEMSEEVSELVLRNNYLQTQAISMMESQSQQRLGEHRHLIRVLERRGTLDRAVENLQDDEQIRERRTLGKGLTRPELALLLAYSKISVYSDLLDSDVPEDPFLSKELIRYFPQVLHNDYAEEMQQHRLRREIIATTVTNSMVNRMGVAFALRLREDTGATPSEVAKAYTIAREVFDARGLWAAIEALDNQVASDVQYKMLLHIWRLLRHATRWVLVHLKNNIEITQVVGRYQKGIHTLGEAVLSTKTGRGSQNISEVRDDLVDAGVPKTLADKVARIPALYPALDIVDVAINSHLPVEQVSRVYFALGNRLSLRWLHRQIENLPVDRQWHAQARGSLRDELYRHHRELTAQVLAHDGTAEGFDQEDVVKYWTRDHKDEVAHMTRMFTDMRSQDNMDYATVSVAVHSLDQLLISA